MSLSLLAYPTQAKRTACNSLAALAISAALAALPLVGPTSTARASDLDYSSGVTEQDDANFLRIGLYKSAVIKLPAAAADVIVGNPAVVDVVVRNKNTAYLFGNSPAQTNVFFFDANGQEILHLDLEVTLDGKGAKKLIDRTIPGNSIQVDTTVGNIVLKGTAANAQEAKLAEDLAGKAVGDPTKVLNAMSIAGGDQVMLKVKVVEIKRDILKELGIDLNAAFQVSNFWTGFATDNPITDKFFQFGASYSGKNAGFDAVVRAMEQEGVVKTLAEPTLTAVSGAAAKFHAGGEYPYTVCETTGTTVATRACTVYFKPYGVSLDFTPTVLSENRISININSEVSELAGTASSGEPTIDTRKT